MWSILAQHSTSHRNLWITITLNRTILIVIPNIKYQIALQYPKSKPSFEENFSILTTIVLEAKNSSLANSGLLKLIFEKMTIYIWVTVVYTNNSQVIEMTITLVTFCNDLFCFRCHLTLTTKLISVAKQTAS